MLGDVAAVIALADKVVTVFTIGKGTVERAAHAVRAKGFGQDIAVFVFGLRGFKAIAMGSACIRFDDIIGCGDGVGGFAQELLCGHLGGEIATQQLDVREVGCGFKIAALAEDLEIFQPFELPLGKNE